MPAATETAIEADPGLPIIRITREFAATPGQLFRAHTDPVDSFEGRDAWLASGLEAGVSDGYAKLQRMVDDGVA